MQTIENGPPLPINSLIVEDWFHGVPFTSNSFLCQTYFLSLGLYTATMLGTLWIIVSSKEYIGSRKYWQIGLVLASYICSTMHASLNWLYYSNAINENEIPTGPGLLYSLTHLPAWIEGTGDTFFCLNIFLADCLFIWRCWTVWNRRWIVVVVPMLATISGAILAGFIISDQVVALRSLEAFTVAKKSEEFVKFSTVYFSLSVATSLTTTLLITLRIIFVQRMSKKNGTGTYHTFNPIMEILIESAVLYSVTLLTFVVLDIRKNTNVYYAQNIHAQMAGLAPLLIVLRVAAGHSRPKEEWSTRISGSLKFMPSNSTVIIASENDAER
ncbi:hypothetical protein B0H17DRAFT_1008470 [Mycena rosella]|uniref:Uncharacterized protein n=1 Tax=Mycena rosella TaxID=1033263 RepID=A0AAD7GM06_MYCRO|nr:hypothetical protein B0H17DRAFT_1008470 [Mycena rosella]